jgi:YfiH family protein
MNPETVLPPLPRGTAELLEDSLPGEVRLACTTRRGGCSFPPYAGLNLGDHVGDVPERVRLNRQAVTRALGRHLLAPVLPQQVHGSVAAPVGPLHAGTRWEQPEAALAGTDALVTATPLLPLVVLTADCLPVALADPVRRVAAAIHAGWRGLAGGVLEATVRLMAETWGCRSRDLRAWLGPAIGACCYRVGAEVAERFPAHATADGDGAFRLDLRAEAARRLAACGLAERNVGGLPLCTCCREDLFFSHRRAMLAGEPATGRQGLFVWLEPQTELAPAS